MKKLAMPLSAGSKRPAIQRSDSAKNFLTVGYIA
jgi:hypothetical protein